jgi:hypothetical protein
LRPKTISRPGIKGQLGVNFIERVVLQMGSQWTPSGANEAGIDGYIEFFDRADGRALGLRIAVQSKVVARVSSAGPTFDYYCSPADVDYWTHGNTPVILVVSNHDATEGYWVSVKDYLASHPGQTTRITFARASDAFSVDAFPRLVALAAPASGLYLPPAPKSETAYSNLLRLVEMPQRLYFAGTDCRSGGDVLTAIRKTAKPFSGAWVLWDRKVISFSDLGEEPWPSATLDGTIEEFPTSDWSESDDPDRQRVFVQVLNRTLRSQIRPGVRHWPQEDSYAMSGPPRRLTYPSIRKAGRISVVSQFTKKSKDGRVFEHRRHMAFRGRFRRLDAAWWLEITPTYRFTTDGFTLHRFHEDWLAGIKRIEKNRAVLSAVLFWAHYLKPKAATLFEGASEPLLRFGDLLTLESPVGIEDARWLAGDPESQDAEDDESAVEAFLDGWEIE